MSKEAICNIQEKPQRLKHNINIFRIKPLTCPLDSVYPQECVFNRLYIRPRFVVSWRRVNIGEQLLIEPA